MLMRGSGEIWCVGYGGGRKYGSDMNWRGKRFAWKKCGVKDEVKIFGRGSG